MFCCEIRTYVELKGRILNSLLGIIVIVAKNGCKPALGLCHLLSFSTSIVLHLIAANLLHSEVVGVRVCKVEATDRASRSHSKRLSKLNTRLLLNLHELPHRGLLSVVGLSWVARSWSDALVLNINALSWS